VRLNDTLPVHPVAALFPLMDGADFDALVEDVRANGLLQPIWLHREGSILDGRNRYAACRMAGVEAQFKTWTGPDEGLVQFVTSMNLHRRHLSAERRAFIAAELASLTHGGDRKSEIKLPSGQLDRPLVSRSEAASVMRVEPRALDRARAVVKHAPELKEKVLSGEMSLSAAARTASEKQAQADTKRDESRAAAVERGKADMKKKREADRLRTIEGARRKLAGWLVAYGDAPEVKDATALVRQAVAVLEEGAR
jgi:hypothetical protein